MVICRSASWSRSSRGTRSLLPGDATEHRADGQAESGEIATAQNIAGHDFTGREHVGGGTVVLENDVRLLVDRDAAIGEGHPGFQWIAVERRRRDGDRPVTFGRREAFGVAIVKRRRVERTRPNGTVVRV